MTTDDYVAMETKCRSLFEQAGWTISFGIPSSSVSNTSRAMYDFIASPKDNSFSVIVEVKNLLSESLRNRSSIIRFVEMIKSSEVEYCIITNSYFYDFYHHGEFVGRLTYCPSPEDIKLICQTE